MPDPVTHHYFSHLVLSELNDETVSIIMAAISAYIAADPALADEYAGGFRVVSFKRAGTKATWNSRK